MDRWIFALHVSLTALKRKSCVSVKMLFTGSDVSIWVQNDLVGLKIRNKQNNLKKVYLPDKDRPPVVPVHLWLLATTVITGFSARNHRYLFLDYVQPKSNRVLF